MIRPTQAHMTLLGITGGVGMGKSTAARILVGRGIPVIDTDDIARQLVSRGEPLLDEIRAEFGAEIIAADGSLNRPLLADKVFSNSTARHRLEKILHPRIREGWLTQVEHWRKVGVVCGLVVIPLLFETQAEEYFQGIICVACSPGTQWARLEERGWGDLQARQRIKAQWAIEDKMRLADTVLWTEGGMQLLERQIDQLSPNALGSPGKLHSSET